MAKIMLHVQELENSSNQEQSIWQQFNSVSRLQSWNGSELLKLVAAVLQAEDKVKTVSKLTGDVHPIPSRNRIPLGLFVSQKHLIMLDLCPDRGVRSLD